MARLPYPEAGSRRADNTAGKPVADRTYTVYLDAACTTLANIAADNNGAPGSVIGGSHVTTDTYGYLPIWWGPADGTKRLYISDGAIAGWPVDAIAKDQIDALTTRVVVLETSGGGGGGGGAVASVAGKIGAVTLVAADVAGVETPAGAQAKADASAAAAVTAHNAATTGVHGITDTSALETTSGAQAKADTARNAAIGASDPAGTAAAAINVHNADTTAVHGIADTTNLETQTGAQARVDALAATVVPNDQRGVATGVATLGPDGKLSGTQIPPLTVVDYLGASANEAAMLTLTGQLGDFTIRTDTATNWIITGGDPTRLDNWTQLSYPSAPVTSVAGRTGAVVPTKADVGLGNADNTADTAKPVSTAQQAALDLKAPIDSPTFTGTVSGVTKAMVGLSNVLNFSPADLGISTDAQAALDLKAPTARAITTTAPLSGGGDLTADRALTVAAATTGTTGVIQLAGDLTGTATAPTLAAGSVTSAKILDGTIVNADISASAAIALSKVAGAAADSAVLHLSGAETVTGPKSFNPGLFLDRGNAVYNATAYAGVDATGATDSAAGLQTAIDASPYGAKWFLPVGTYRWDTTVTLNRGRSLEGANFWHQRDVSPVAYGDDWSTTATTMVGTIIRSTVTTGPALLVTSNGGNNAMVGTRLKDFMLIGPGAPGSVGLGMGESTPSARVVLRPIVDNVKVANFATGAVLQHVNEAKIDLVVQACVKAVSLITDVNNITWSALNMQRCADGLVFEDASCVTNEFVAPICQNVSGTGFTIQGEDHQIHSPYFENTPTIATFIAAQLCGFWHPTVQGSGVKTLTIASGSNDNTFWGLKGAAGNFTIANAGSNNIFQGRLGTAVTGSGSNPWLFDTSGGALSVRNFIAPSTSGPSFQAGSAIGFRFGASGPQVINISASPEGATTAPAGSVAVRSTGGGYGSTLYVKESGTGNTGWRPVNSGPDLGMYVATDPRWGYTTGVDLTTPITNVLAAMPATGGTLFIPDGNWTATGPFAWKTGVRVMGAGRSGTVLTVTGGFLTWSQSTHDVSVESMRINCSGGHMFSSPNGTSALYLAEFRDCLFMQTSTGFSIMNHVGTACDHIKVKLVDCDLYRPAGATVPGWKVTNSTGAGGAANAITLQNLRVNSSSGGGTTPFFYFESTSTTANYIFDLVAEDIVGEGNQGGVIAAYSARSAVFRNVVDWDLAVGVTYTGDIVKVGKSTATGSTASKNIMVHGCGRNGGTAPASGWYDVNLVPGEVKRATVVEFHNSGVSGKINFGTGDFVNVLNAPDASFTGQLTGFTNYLDGGLQVASPGLSTSVAAVTGLTGATAGGRFAGATASGAPASGTFAARDYVVSADGNFYICTVAGTPGTWVTVGTPATLTALAADAPVAGEFVPRRERWTSNAVGPGSSGTLMLSYFTADKSETIANITMWSGATAAGATPTLARMGIYTVDATGNLTLAAACASDTTLFGTVNTAYTRSLTASLAKTVGTRYACALLVVTGAAVPTFHGQQWPATGPINTTHRVSPALVGRVTGQTDLPATVAVGSIVGFQGAAAFQLT